MKNYALILIHVLTAAVLFGVACTDAHKNQLQGKWLSKDGHTKLHITEKHLTMDENALISEEYFMKGDTIYTSYQGNSPYTKFVVQKLDNNDLTLIDPDSTSMEFSR
jgi:hypothetical protein